MDEYIFTTEDGVKILLGQKAFWCAYRYNKWVYVGAIKTSKDMANLSNSEYNKAFSSEELAKKYLDKAVLITCINEWKDLPQVISTHYHIFHDVSSDNNQSYLTVSVLHFDNNNNIICDYLKTVKLKSKYKIDLTPEIERRMEELISYFKE